MRHYKRNVRFEKGEVINGWEVVSDLGFGTYYFKNDEGLVVMMQTLAGEGFDNFALEGVRKNGRNYTAYNRIKGYNDVAKEFHLALMERFNEANKNI